MARRIVYPIRCILNNAGDQLSHEWRDLDEPRNFEILRSYVQIRIILH
jgi:hypothetical protein